MNKINVFEAFAGIGAQRKALTKLIKGTKIKANFVGYAEWDIHAIIAYNKIHYNSKIIPSAYWKKDKKKMIDYLKTKNLSSNTKTKVKANYWEKLNIFKLTDIYYHIKFSEKNGNIFDIKNLSKKTYKNIDLLTYSFPCTNLSIQGKREGIKKGNESGLLYEIEKYLKITPKKNLPQFLLMENVPALINKRNIKIFEKWKKELVKLGYNNDYKILDATNFGSVQKRKRIFMVSTLGKKINLPTKKRECLKWSYQEISYILEPLNKKNISTKLNKYLPNKLESNVEVEKRWKWKKGGDKRKVLKIPLNNYSTYKSENTLYHPFLYGPTLTATGALSKIKIAWYSQKKYKYFDRIRIMTPQECWKYMGFTNYDYWKVEIDNLISPNKMRMLAGNSICIEILEEIFRIILKLPEKLCNNVCCEKKHL